MDRNSIERFSVNARVRLRRNVESSMAGLGIGEGCEPASVDVSGDTHILNLPGGLRRTLTSGEYAWREKLIDAVSRDGYDNVVEQVAYTWFNRLIAIRYMEVNDYLPTHVRVLSSMDPEKKEPDLVTQCIRMSDALRLTTEEKNDILDLKDRSMSDELFSKMFLYECRSLNAILPELFSDTKPYEKLLINLSYTVQDGVVRELVDTVPEEDFRDAVQIIGWMYQYYNTELNNLVYDGSLSKSKIPKELIPAATTIYTPDWVVKYMVDNSLGRLWVEHGQCDIDHSVIKYLKHSEVIARVNYELSPEKIMVIDPCMGSGHILVYFFDLLVEIYKSCGYGIADAADLIVQKNLYGLDINERAYQLAYFAVMMKARFYDPLFFTKDIRPNLSSFIESRDLSLNYIENVMTQLNDVDKKTLTETLKRFYNAKDLGSLIKGVNVELLSLHLRNIVTKPTLFYNIVEQKEKLEKILFVSNILSKKYDVIVTNPPYLRSSRFDSILFDYSRELCPRTKSDLSMMMYETTLKNISKNDGYVAFITTNSWMFLSSFEKMRLWLLDNYSIIDILDLGSELFEGKVGHNLIVSWVTKNTAVQSKTSVTRLVDFCYSKKNLKENEFYNNKNEYQVDLQSFKRIPGAPIAYSLNGKLLELFKTAKKVGDYCTQRMRITTGDNDRFLRLWFEVPYFKLFYPNKWIPLSKGGRYRKWYGNWDYVINYENNGEELNSFKGYSGGNTDFFFKPGIVWTDLTSGGISFRLFPEGCIAESGGPMIYSEDQKKMLYLEGYLNSSICRKYTDILCPTLHFRWGDVSKIPVIYDTNCFDEVCKLVSKNNELAKNEYDLNEMSWDFKTNPLLELSGLISERCSIFDNNVDNLHEKIRNNEERLNSIFINAESLSDISPIIPDSYFSFYKESRQVTIFKLISYSIGCMFGRYSLDKKGIINAGGDWIDPSSIFKADLDNIIPINDNEYFGDDIVVRFVEFIKVAFGEDHLEKNLKFIADNLGIKYTGTARDGIRKYFLNNFYDKHVKMYQKRPIYWLFDSGKENGFKALIYMHRYTPDLISKMRQDYLLPMLSRYIEQLNSADEITKMSLQKKIAEIQTYDIAMEKYASKKVSIDLDDGVNVNYAKFQNIENPGSRKRIDLLHPLK